MLILSATRPDGRYLFREKVNHYWRAIVVKKGWATSGWIQGTVHTNHLRGEWEGPLVSNNERFVQASKDSMGRLLWRDTREYSRLLWRDTREYKWIDLLGWKRRKIK